MPNSMSPSTAARSGVPVRTVCPLSVGPVFPSNTLLCTTDDLSRTDRLLFIALRRIPSRRLSVSVLVSSYLFRFSLHIYSSSSVPSYRIVSYLFVLSHFTNQFSYSLSRFMSLRRNFRNFSPCNGFVKKSANISSVGQYSTVSSFRLMLSLIK